MTALLAGVGILLLIACANLANLLLARGAARRAEMTLRLSLGAARGRLMRQLVTESLVLAAGGGVAAAAVAAALHRALVVMLAEADPTFVIAFAFDPQIAFVLAICTVAAALLFGLLPAWQATAMDAASALKEQGRGAISGRGRGRTGRILVGAQLALSLPLLVGAGLLARTAYNVQRVDFGFTVDNLLTARLDLRATSDDPARRDALRQALLERIRQAPGVRAATFSQLGIFTGSFSTRTVAVAGYVPPPGRAPETTLDSVGPDYFTTLGTRVIQGRELDRRDTRGAPLVCVVNEAFAARFLAGRNPVGLNVTMIDNDPRGIGTASSAWSGMRVCGRPKSRPTHACSSPRCSSRRVRAARRFSSARNRTRRLPRQSARRSRTSMPTHRQRRFARRARALRP